MGLLKRLRRYSVSGRSAQDMEAWARQNNQVLYRYVLQQQGRQTTVTRFFELPRHGRAIKRVPRG